MYSYAIHRDVHVDWYAICNGREFALYHVADMSATPRLRFDLRDLTANWGAGRMRGDRFRLPTDGSRGEREEREGHLLQTEASEEEAVVLVELAPITDAPARPKESVDVNVEGARYAISFDFESDVFAAFLALLDQTNARNLAEALAVEPTIVHVVGELGVLRLTCRLGALEETKREHIVPLKVLSVALAPD